MFFAVHKPMCSCGDETDCFNCLQQSKDVVSVRGGCVSGIDWTKAVHIWTKSAMVPIPESSESYSEESADSSGQASAQQLLD